MHSYTQQNSFVLTFGKDYILCLPYWKSIIHFSVLKLCKTVQSACGFSHVHVKTYVSLCLISSFLIYWVIEDIFSFCRTTLLTFNTLRDNSIGNTGLLV